MAKAVTYRCPECLASVSLTTTGKWRKHGEPTCEKSGERISPQQLIDGPDDAKDDAPKKGRDYDECPACGRTPKLDEAGNFRQHMTEQNSADECPLSGRNKDGKTASVTDIPEGYSEDLWEWRKARNEAKGSPGSKNTLPDSKKPSPPTPPETIALATGSPQTAHALIPPTIPTENAAPEPAVALDTRPPTNGPKDVPAANPSQIIGAGQSIATASEDAQPTLPPRLCSSCGKEIGGRHVCFPIFKNPGPVEEGIPAELFVNPDPIPAAMDVQPMTPKGEEIAARLREIFFAFVNRTERSNQSTLGPSEIGSPCDRRLALSLMRVPAVNPGGDSWASFVGTSVHETLARVFEWANAGTGRFATEQRVDLRSETVPYGTADLLDRVLYMVDDHKIMGRWSLDKLRTKGPSETYRVQVHTYAYGMRLRGERVDHVAIIGWPRDQSTLKDLYVWTEPYKPEVAQKALARVEEIALAAKQELAKGPTELEVAYHFKTADDCTYCPFHAKGDLRMERGCPGV